MHAITSCAWCSSITADQLPHPEVLMRALRYAPLALVPAAGLWVNHPPDAKTLAADAMPQISLPPSWAPGTAAGEWVQTGQDAVGHDARSPHHGSAANNYDLRVRRRASRAAALEAAGGSTLYPRVTAIERRGQMSGDSSNLSGGGFFANWGSTSGAACAAGPRPAPRNTRRRRTTPSTRANRSPRWSRRAGSPQARRQREIAQRMTPPASAPGPGERTGRAPRRR
jgi:hypothetical protein